MPRPRVFADLTPFRRSRDLRLVVAGDCVSTLGSQATLVALPFQLYEVTRSPTLVGLLGAVELGPLILMSLYGGALADRIDRRALLIGVQLGVLVGCGGLAVAAIVGHPALATLYVLGGVLAGFNAMQNASLSAIVPGLVADRRELPAVMATTFGLSSLATVLGPGLGGILIGALGVQAAYLVDAASCLAIVLAFVPVAPQAPGAPGGDRGDGDARGAGGAGVVAAHEPILRSIADGLRYVRGNRALVGSFAIDLVAMTFGLPRALFAVLAVGVYHAGAGGTGLLYTSVAVGATAAALLTGWTRHARRLGLICIWAVVAWAVAVTVAGVAGSVWLAAALFAVAGAADSVSAVCRSTINQSVTPDRMRGRMSSVFGLVVTGGPRLGDVESGLVAGGFGVRQSVVSGGLACLVGVAAIVVAFPALARFDVRDWQDGAGAGADAGERLRIAESRADVTL